MELQCVINPWANAKFDQWVYTGSIEFYLGVELMLIRLEQVEKVSKKGIFDLFLTLWPTGLLLGMIKKFWTTQLYDHMCQGYKY